MRLILPIICFCLALSACSRIQGKRPRVDKTEPPGTVGYFCAPEDEKRGICGAHDVAPER